MAVSVRLIVVPGRLTRLVRLQLTNNRLRTIDPAIGSLVRLSITSR
jgi:hypothetical protein